MIPPDNAFVMEDTGPIRDTEAGLYQDWKAYEPPVTESGPTKQECR